MNPTHLKHLLHTCLATLALALALTSPARADDVQANGLWVPNVTIGGISGGEIQYMTNMGSDVSIPLTQVTGIKVSAYPDLWAAQEAILAKNDTQALPLLLRVEGTARQPWVKNHASFLKVHTLDRMDRAVEAAEAFLTLARTKPDRFYLQRPPILSLPKASDAQKADIAGRLRQALPDFDGVAKAAIEAMLKLVDTPAGPGNAPAAPGAPAAPATPAVPTTTPGIVTSNDKITNNTGVAITTYMLGPDRDPVSAMLFQGQWQAAADKTREMLSQPESRMSMRLYQQGMAVLQLAEQSGNLDAYKNAGLSFSRSVIHFPTSSVAGPSLVELAYIHQKIGRPDTALKLLDKARLQVDETQDPQVFARLEKLIAELSTGGAAEPATPAPVELPANP